MSSDRPSQRVKQLLSDMLIPESLIVIGSTAAVLSALLMVPVLGPVRAVYGLMFGIIIAGIGIALTPGDSSD